MIKITLTIMAVLACLLLVVLPGVLTHILLSLLSVSILFVAAFQACLLGMQHYCLKVHRQPLGLGFIPPLETIERGLFKTLWIGLISLTAALITGWLFVDAFFNPSLPHLAPKIILSVGAWLLIAALLIGRELSGWRGMTAMRWTLGSVALLLFAYFGTKFLF